MTKGHNPLSKVFSYMEKRYNLRYHVWGVKGVVFILVRGNKKDSS